MAQGSLERLARSIHGNWETRRSAIKCELVTELYRERVARLKRLETQFGPFPEVYLAHIRNEQQFQRLIAIYGNHECNVRPVEGIFQTAHSLWPDNHLLLAAEAKFHRYIWNYAAAIVGLRNLIRATPNGDLRREATLDLIETLLAAAMHCPILTFTDATTIDRAMMISEAQQALLELAGFRHVAKEVAILRDRVEFELGKSIDWAAIDDVYTLVIGGVEAYPSTVVNNLDELLAERSDIPVRLSDAVRQNCTNSRVLTGLGLLYLRRAEKERGHESLSDCERAYAVFNACRLLERSWLRTELATTSYP